MVEEHDVASVSRLTLTLDLELDAHSSLGSAAEVEDLLDVNMETYTAVDDDRLLIIALIIILSADGADMLTIFALMYILM